MKEGRPPTVYTALSGDRPRNPTENTRPVPENPRRIRFIADGLTKNEFVDWLSRYRTKYIKVVLWRSRIPYEDACDVVQDATIKAITHFEPEISEPGIWFCRILLNTLYDYHRNAYVRHERPLSWMATPDFMELLDAKAEEFWAMFDENERLYIEHILSGVSAADIVVSPRIREFCGYEALTRAKSLNLEAFA